MSDRLRIEVEGHGRGHILYVATPDTGQAEAVAGIVAQAIADAEQVCGAAATEELLALLVEQTADARAYEREASRRGVLAL